MNFRLLFILIFMFSALSLFSQICIKTGFSIADNIKAQEFLFRDVQENKIFRNNYNFGLGYQYIFEGTGMSLIPGLGYSYSETRLFEGKIRLNKIGFELPFKIFPFNMEGDCNCPDFSMRNKFFEKHFFLILNTGVNYSIKTNYVAETSRIKDINFKSGVGTGISFSVFKSIILSPSLNYNWFFNDNWNKRILNISPN